MTYGKKSTEKFYAIIFILITILSIIITPLTAHAQADVNSNVIYDLSHDSSFDISQYSSLDLDNFKAVNSDTNPDNDVQVIKVIQIGESENNELFIYTYEPLLNVYGIKATSINIATTESAIMNMAVKDDTTEFKKYELERVSSEGTLNKYLVKDFVVSDNYYRYFAISEIERPYSLIIDGNLNDSSTTITEYITHSVGQLWCCYYSNNELKYEMETLNVVEITPTHTGELLYPEGVTWGNLVGMDSMCVSHYISFNVDNYQVDKIIDASLVYKYREYEMEHTLETGIAPTILSWFGVDTEHTVTRYPEGEDYSTKPLDIYDTDEVTYEGAGLLAKKFSWNRIMTGHDFVDQYESQGLTWNDKVKETVGSSQFVFAFCETSLETWQTSSTSGDGGVGSTTTYISTAKGTEVAKVDILRLKFMVGENTYNLGVVGNTTSSDGIPDGFGNALELDLSALNDLFNKIKDSLNNLQLTLETVFAIVMLIVLVVVLVNVIIPVFKPLIKFVIKIITAILNAFISILTFPFRIFTRKRK